MRRTYWLGVAWIEFALFGCVAVTMAYCVDPINPENAARVTPGMSKEDVEKTLGPASGWSYRVHMRMYCVNAYGQSSVVPMDSSQRWPEFLDAYRFSNSVDVKTSHVWVGQSMTIRADFCDDNKVIRVDSFVTRVNVIQRIRGMLRRNQPITGGPYLTPISGCAQTLPD